jgi:hypothetical protein
LIANRAAICELYILTGMPLPEVCGECTADWDCDDSNECTINICENPSSPDAVCQSVPVTGPCAGGAGECVDGWCVLYDCTSDADCDDGNECTLNVCENPGTLDAVCSITLLTGPCQGDTGVCTDGVCVPVKRLVFVSSGGFSGNLGGLDGGDQICNQNANAAGLPGEYKAWLSSYSIGPASRFVHASVPYVLTDGVQVASSWSDIVDGQLAHPISVDQYGNPQSGRVWTGTTPNGLPSAETCSSWSWHDGGGGSPYSVPFGDHGDASLDDSRWTLEGTDSCDSAGRLYCFQQ